MMTDFLFVSFFSFDVDKEQGSPSSSVAYPMIKLPKRKDRPFKSKEARSHDPKSSTSPYNYSDMSQFYNPWGWSPAASSGAETGIPYRTWSQYLLRTFNLQLYNEFRRLALDDLFTRHTDYGFNALMSYYQASLLSPTPTPDPVLADIVHLSDDRTTKLNTEVFELLCSSMASGQIEDTNRCRIGFFYNEVYGQSRQAWRNFTA